MKTALLALGFVILTNRSADADDAALRAIIAKAIKAHDGDNEPGKLAASTMRIKGTVHAMGMEVSFDGTAYSFGPERQKIELDGEVAGQKFHIVSVLNGNKGWSRFDKETKDFSKDELAEVREKTYASYLSSVVPLRGKAFTFASLGEVMIDSKPAIGIKVSSKGYRDLDMYFDKASHLLVKTEARVKDDGGTEVFEETHYREYKEVQGAKLPTKFLVRRDGKLYMEAEASDYVLSEKLDDATFAKP